MTFNLIQCSKTFLLRTDLLDQIYIYIYEWNCIMQTNSSTSALFSGKRVIAEALIGSFH